MSFLPQRPYIPLGTLRNALVYPGSPDAFTDADVRRALERCDLQGLIPKLDRVERWDKELSLESRSASRSRVSSCRVGLLG